MRVIVTALARIHHLPGPAQAARTPVVERVLGEIDALEHAMSKRNDPDGS